MEGPGDQRGQWIRWTLPARRAGNCFKEQNIMTFKHSVCVFIYTFMLGIPVEQTVYNFTLG